MGTVFVAGSYGVGKSTLCDQLSHCLGMHFDGTDADSCISLLRGALFK